MIWKINFLVLLCSFHSFGLSLPHVQKRDISSPPGVSYEWNMNSKVLGVLKKAYVDLKNTTDSRQSDEVPRTYGMSLTGEKGIVWNMLKDAKKAFEVGGRSGRSEKQSDITERSTPEEQQADPQESEENVYLQIFSELLEDDEFWNWLTGWIETYTELLDEHIKVEVEEAVTKQIKEYFDRLDYLINEEEASDPDPDPQQGNSGQQQGSGALASTQHISNSTVSNVANIYFTDPTAEKALVDSLAKAIVSISKDTGVTLDERSGK